MSDLRIPSVPSLQRGLAILEILADSRKGLTLSNLTQRMRLPKSSVHSLLLTLERTGYLHRSEVTGRYLFGTKLFSLATKSVSRLELKEQALPSLASLAKETGLTVHMAIPERGTAILIEKIDPPGLIRLATWPGKQMDLHCTGVGKALLAYLPQEEMANLIRGYGLPQHNTRTLSSARRLREELVQIRDQGYAYDDEEDEVGLRCIGAPVFDRNRVCIAAISVAGTTAQIHPDNLDALARKIRRVADTVSFQMGFLSDLSITRTNRVSSIARVSGGNNETKSGRDTEESE
jgi:DNA-binding IclR family transcriptional regulator